MHYLVLLAIATLVLHPQPSTAGVVPTLIVDKDAVPSPVIPGNLITFPITASPALGSPDVLNLSISDPLNPATTFVSATASPGATLTTPLVGTNGTVTSVWDAAGGTPGGLTAAGTTRSLTIVARMCPEAGCFCRPEGCVGGSNTATASGTNAGPSPVTRMIALSPSPDLSITKDALPQPILPGGSFVYNLNVSNAGPSTSSTTRVVDTLPAGFVATNVTSTMPASCAIGTGGQTVTCDFALGAANQCAPMPIPANGTITIDVTVAPGTPAGTHTNTATIAIFGPCGVDPNPSNNTATAGVEVVVAPAPLLSPFGLMLSLALLIGIGALAMRRLQPPIS